MNLAVDLTLTSDELAYSIGDAAKEIAWDLPVKFRESLYVVGNAADFDEFCVPVLTHLEPAAVACLWPKVSKSRTNTGHYDVRFQGEYIQPLPSAPEIVVVQSVAATAEEIVAMLTLVLQKTRPSKITLAACLASSYIENSLKGYFNKAGDVIPILVQAQHYFPGGVDAFEFQQRAFDLLDNRPVKDAPHIPTWVHDRIIGRRPDPEPGANNQPPPAPSTGGARHPPIGSEWQDDQSEDADDVPDLESDTDSGHDGAKFGKLGG